ncbi:hypothetical protein ABNF97_11650 [Plantactinospora sp. B6F1]|uniref:hypothetical protein n=1 Tax=Plantactinospora sp. B6F1 TaxID=3158971 RepID=UPI0032D96A5A
MTDPVLATAVAALVSRATTEVAEGSRFAVQSLISFVRERFLHRPAERAVVDVAFAEPPNPATVSRLVAR